MAKELTSSQSLIPKEHEMISRPIASWCIMCTHSDMFADRTLENIQVSQCSICQIIMYQFNSGKIEMSPYNPINKMLFISK